MPTRRLIFTLFMLFMAISPVRADSTWIGTTGDWDDSANWDGNVPTSSDVVRIINGGTATLPEGVSGSYANLGVGGPSTSGSIAINGGLLSGGYTYLSGSATISSGSWSITTYLADSGSLLINGGSVSSKDTEIRFGGSATVSSGSWSSSGYLYVGYGGTSTASLLINGGSVSSKETTLGFYASDTGSATISSGSWSIAGNFTVGYKGTGSLLINGGSVVSNGDADIGGGIYYSTNGGTYTYDPGHGTGSVTVSNGSWSTGYLDVGHSGTGSLLINGGSVSSGYATIGADAGSTGSATVSSGSWTAGALFVGWGGTGSLLINGGSVSSTAFSGGIYIGYGSTGSATVSSGSLTISHIYVGLQNGATGTLLLNGGSISSGDATIGFYAGSTGSATVTGQGTRWINTGNLTVGGGGSNNTLTIENGGLVKVGETIAFSTNGGTNNFLLLDGGYLALFGDQTDSIAGLISDGKIKLWDGSEWVVSTDATDFSLAYFDTDAAAFAATGYDDLGGYTILTTPVPEPGTLALALVGVLAGALIFRRRASQSIKE